MELRIILDTLEKTTPSYRKPEPTDNRSEALVEIEKVKASIPAHLRPYIVDQYETHYTAEDQAVWRYCLRQLKHFLAENAEESYLDGLKKTGITVNEIPSIDQMCLRLKSFGWSAVPVSGFIPPAAFMELQSLGILPIATAMRSVDHILYTPAPDIVHEAAGHAPILVDPKFAAYLKSYAGIAKKALIAKHDLDQYDAIRNLSDLKEHPDSTDSEIKAAEDLLQTISQNMKFVSEAALLGRMNWWTAEYGLIGETDDPKIYGAGLLSSLGEAKECLKPKVHKIPLTVDCVKYAYDITEPQPQLFVAPDFDCLKRILEELAETLAFRRGGTYGLDKSIEAETVNTVELSSGLQISGLLVEALKDEGGEAFYYRFSGPCQLSSMQQELPGHGSSYHKEGFSSPLGRIKGLEKPLELAEPTELKSLGLVEGEVATLTFVSGVTVRGVFTSALHEDNKLVLLSFKSCKVTFEDQVLFDPSWGDFDMAVGEVVTSVFAGPADRVPYGMPENLTPRKVLKRTLSPRMDRLCQLYLALRDMRKNNQMDLEQVRFLSSELTRDFPEQWLLRLEILEILERGWLKDDVLLSKIRLELQKIKKEFPETEQVIEDGLKISHQIL